MRDFPFNPNSFEMSYPNQGFPLSGRPGPPSQCYPDFVEVKAAPSQPVPKAMVRTRPRSLASVKKMKGVSKNKKKKRNGAGPRRGPLSNVSAADVSFQDAADFLGAAWKYGSRALALINDEEKRLYVAQSDAVINTSQIYYLTAIGQGTDYYQRNGNSIKVSNIRLDFLLTVNATAVNNTVRVIVFRDLMNTGSNPGASDLLQDTSTTTLTLTSPYKVFNGDRFLVLYDEVFHMSVGSDDALIHKRIGLAVDDHVLYQNTGSTVASAWQGATFALVLSDNAVNKPFLTLSSLTDFVDS